MNRAVKKHSGVLESSEGNPIRYDLYAPHMDTGSLPVILFLHGFKGFKDWGTFPDAFFEIARQGFAVLAFNFSHSGVGTDFDSFEYPELFKTQTLSQELNDIQSVLEALTAGKIGESAGFRTLFPIGIIGHSRGGHTAIAAAAEFDDISCVVTWAAVANCLEFWPDSMKKDWASKGETIIENARTKQKLPVGKQLLDDAEANKARLIAMERVKELYLPCLFIHGNDDETVPHINCQKLYETCPSYDKEKILIEAGNHTFGSVHPYQSDELPPKFTEVIEHTVHWFQLHMNGA